ncbi:MAG: Zn-ribbon domain-containing OB-fold protein [Rhodospirillaceae bacterium]
MAHTAEDLHEHPFLAGDAVRLASDGRARLYGTGCNDCGTKIFPPTPVCPECMSENVSEIELSGEGTLYSWSVVHVAPKNWHVPYVAGYVDLPEGVRVFTHVVGADPGSLSMDMQVALTTAVLGEEDGTPVESYAFTPKQD